MAIGGHQVGPMSIDELAANIRSGTAGPDTLVFGPGMKEWRRLADVAELAAILASGRSNGDSPPIPSIPGRRAHDIDFKIVGSEMQFVEVELDPGECAIAEAGAMMYMTNGIGLETVFGDGSKPSGGILDALVGAGKRLVIGESLFMTVFQNQAKSGKERVALDGKFVV
jgi:hypothetical protein